MSESTVSAINVLGMVLDAFGGLLLAYDLLGGEHGTLRLLLRIVSYTLASLLMLMPTMGLHFAIVAAPAFGLALGLDLGRAAKGRSDHSLKHETLVAGIRSLGIGLAVWNAYSFKLGLVFAALTFVVVVVLHASGVMKQIPLTREVRPTLRLDKLAFALRRGLMIAVMAIVSAYIVGPTPETLTFSVRFGVTLCLVLSVMSVYAPLVEWWVDRIPDRVLGTVGCWLFVAGFGLQCIPDLCVLMKIRLH